MKKNFLEADLFDCWLLFHDNISIFYQNPACLWFVARKMGVKSAVTYRKKSKYKQDPEQVADVLLPQWSNPEQTFRSFNMFSEAFKP